MAWLTDAAVLAIVVLTGHVSADCVKKSCFVCTKGLSEYDPNWHYAPNWKNLTQDVWQALWKDMVLEAPGPNQDDCVQVKISEDEKCADLLTADRMQLANDTVLEESKDLESSAETPEQKAAVQPTVQARKLDYMRLWPAVRALKAWQKQKDHEKIFAELGDLSVKFSEDGQTEKAAKVHKAADIIAASHRRVANAEIQSHDDLAVDGDGKRSGSTPKVTDIQTAGLQAQPATMVNHSREFLQSKPPSLESRALRNTGFAALIHRFASIAVQL